MIKDFLDEYEAEMPARFHMPGHKGRGNALRNACSFDITEIPGADELGHPSGMIQEAEEKTASFYGARHTFFGTNGATGAILAAIWSLPKEFVVCIARDVHKSVISALTLSGHAVRFLPCRIQKDGRMALQNEEDLRNTLLSIPEKRRAAFLTRPDYYGRCFSLDEMAKICDELGAVLIVDEAHGAHFALSSKLPAHALHGADIVINSAHKTLDAPNQAAYLHLGKANRQGAPSVERLAGAMRLFQTSSPSYPLLLALSESWKKQEDAWGEHMQRLEKFLNELSEPWQNATEQGKQEERDASRLCFDVSSFGETGWNMEKYLRKQGIYMEMSDERRIVGITSPLDDSRWYTRLKLAMEQKDDGHGKLPEFLSQSTLLAPNEAVLSFREVAQCESEERPLQESIGRVCAQALGAYPPGIPWIFPGERITEEIICQMGKWLESGGNAFGIPIRCVVE